MGGAGRRRGGDRSGGGRGLGGRSGRGAIATKVQQSDAEGCDEASGTAERKAGGQAAVSGERHGKKGKGMVVVKPPDVRTG